MFEKLVNQFKKLQETGPSSEWTKNTRNFLIAKVQQDTLTQEPSCLSQIKLFSNIWFKRMVPSSVKVISIFAIIALIGGTGLVAQAEYIPTRPLYTVKRTLEKIELVLAITAKSETKVHLKHADKRKAEAVKLAKKTSLSTEEKEGLINTVVSSLEQDISAAASSLEIINETNKESGKVLELAKKITQTINENIGDLDQVKEIASLEGVDESVSEVQSNIEESGNSSLEVLIKEAESLQGDEEVISTDELKQIIYNKIERTSGKINGIYEVIKGINPDEIVIYKEEFRVGTTDIKIQLNVEEVINEAVEKLTGAQEILNQAKLSLEAGSLSEALEKVKKSNEIVIEAEGILAQIVDVETEIEAPSQLINEEEVIGEQNIKGVIETITEIDNATSSTSKTTPDVIE